MAKSREPKTRAIPTWYDELVGVWGRAVDRHKTHKVHVAKGEAYETVLGFIANRFEQHSLTWRQDITGWGVRKTRSQSPFHALVHHLHRSVPAHSTSVLNKLSRVLDLWQTDKDNGLAPDGIIVWLRERDGPFKVYDTHLQRERERSELVFPYSVSIRISTFTTTIEFDGEAGTSLYELRTRFNEALAQAART